MSTGLECTFEEIAPGTWYYLLERDGAPASTWDWREYATAYGPFTTQEAAHTHLSEHHANPGGYLVTRYEDRQGKPIDKTLRALIKNAIMPDRHTTLARARFW